MDDRDSGLGQPHESDYFFRGWRDPGQGAPTERKVITDPSRGPQILPAEKQRELDELFYRIRDLMKTGVFYSKRPAFVEPPFFSTPVIKAIKATIAPAATTGLFDREIPDRHRAMVTMIGLEVAPLLAVQNQQVIVWFSNPPVGSLSLLSGILPVFDDQTSGLGLRFGQTTVLPGSIENPFNFMEHGLAFQVRGPKRLVFAASNNSGANITIRGVMGYYQYWTPNNAEFEAAEIQL